MADYRRYWQNYWQNLVNKLPKLLFLLVVLYALSENRDAVFGRQGREAAPEAPTRFDPALVAQFFGHAALLTTDDSVMYEVRTVDEPHALSGYLIAGRQADNSARGFGGPVSVVIFLDREMIVRGVSMLPNNETPRFVRRLAEARFLEKWNGRHLYDRIPDVDALSGATHTSQAVIADVNKTLAALLRREPKTRSWDFVTNYLGEFAVLFVTVMSLACFLSPETTRRIRIPLLVLSVAVLGIWQGAFVSLSLLYNWLLFGASSIARFGTLAVVLAAVLIPLFTNRDFYCAYLCPFGAAQELVGKVWPGKRPIPKRVLKGARWGRRLLLAAVVGLLILRPRFELADIEPFTAFLIRSAATSSIVLAVLGLGASLFFHRPWCRIVCPTGELLAILRRRLRYPKLRERRRDDESADRTA